MDSVAIWAKVGLLCGVCPINDDGSLIQGKNKRAVVMPRGAQSKWGRGVGNTGSEAAQRQRNNPVGTEPNLILSEFIRIGDLR